MPPIVSIVGKSKTGKTTLLERLVAELKGRGYRVATIKHSAYGFDLDLPGKDSWRHAQAGSDAILISSPDRLALIKKVDHDLSLGELSQLLRGDFDIILSEGFKHDKGLKVEVHRRELGELTCDPQRLIALVTDEPLELDVPQFPHDEVKGLADLIEKKLPKLKEETTLFVNGDFVPLSPFPQEFISKTVCGMVSTLKGISEPKSIDISIRRKE
jgi:molybdopterin-guanine dinucleotide biosynthesis protein B